MNELEVDVFDGSRLVQRWPCSRLTMPDGSERVVWRGVAYPLLPGNRIDIAGEDASPAPPRHTVMTTDGAAWILLRGLPVELDATRRAVTEGGIEVLRSGRWLGEPVDGQSFDWFLRCAAPVDMALVAELLGEGQAAAPRDEAAARVGVLEQRIAELVAQLAQLRQQAPITVPDAAAPDGSADDLDEPAEVLESRPLLSAPAIRLSEELEAMLEALRPDLKLLRGSMTVAAGEFASRSGFYRAIRELPGSGARPEGWKLLRGADRWWERHVSTGRDNSGRAYARFSVEARQWSLLLGWKTEQAKDIAWLSQQ